MASAGGELPRGGSAGVRRERAAAGRSRPERSRAAGKRLRVSLIPPDTWWLSRPACYRRNALAAEQSREEGESEEQRFGNGAVKRERVICLQVVLPSSQK